MLILKVNNIFKVFKNIEASTIKGTLSRSGPCLPVPLKMSDKCVVLDKKIIWLILPWDINITKLIR